MVLSRRYSWYACILVFLCYGFGTWLSPALGDELKEAQDKLLILEAAKDFVLRRLSAMNNVIDEYEAALKTLKAKIDIEKPEFDHLKKRLRELDELIAKVRSPYELAEAYAKYKKSAKTVQDFNS